MLYETKKAWESASKKRVMLFGMSGLGKTHISTLLRRDAGWFHYSVDYRIGTRYMGEYIADNFKREAMKVPLLRELLYNDGVTIASNITFDNLAPLSTYLGKPGDPVKGGVPWDEYLRRQAQHRDAETAAMLDTGYFIRRAGELYGYDNFICDTSGSVCEIVDPNDPKDPVLSALSENLLMVWIEGSNTHTEELVRRFDRAPKPMCYQAGFLDACWAEYLAEREIAPDHVDPDDFVRWTYARALAHRQPRYRTIAENWGITLAADEVAKVQSETDFNDLVGTELANR